jgi:Sec-independent protein translocase protein TatA
MFGFGTGELLLVAAVVVVALFSGRSVADMASQAGRMTGLWLKIKQKLSLLRFMK